MAESGELLAATWQAQRWVHAVAERVRKDARARDSAAKEIYTSEKSYVESLEELVDLFVKPLRRAAETGSPIISTRSIGSIFSNVEEIVKVGHELLKMLEDRLATWAERQTIADVFVCLGPYLATYTVYVVNYPKALVTLNDKTHKAQFAAFLKRALEQGAKQYQTVASYLIMPVQRIPRYQLLLRELLRVTPEAHPDHRYLTESLERMTELAVKINETIREEEELEKVIAIQKKFTGNPPFVASKRSFLTDGEVIKICRKSPKPRHFFLFSDVLVYASANVGESFTFHRMIDLRNARVQDVPDKHNHPAFQILAKEKSFTVYCKDEGDKAMWIRALRKAIENLSAGDADAGAGAQAPVWVPDQESGYCMVCNVKFTVINRRHHCRRCGIIVCNKCSSARFHLENLGKSVRVCSSCFETLIEEHGGWAVAASKPGLFQCSRQTALQARNVQPDLWGAHQVHEWIENVFDGKFASLSDAVPQRGCDLIRLTQTELVAMIESTKLPATSGFDAQSLANQLYIAVVSLKKRCHPTVVPDFRRNPSMGSIGAPSSADSSSSSAAMLRSLPRASMPVASHSQLDTSRPTRAPPPKPESSDEEDDDDDDDDEDSDVEVVQEQKPSQKPFEIRPRDYGRIPRRPPTMPPGALSLSPKRPTMPPPAPASRPVGSPATTPPPPEAKPRHRHTPPSASPPKAPKSPRALPSTPPPPPPTTAAPSLPTTPPAKPLPMPKAPEQQAPTPKPPPKPKRP